MAWNPQTKKVSHAVDIEGFWLGDKFRIRAVPDTFAQLNPMPNPFMLRNRGEGVGMAS